MMYKFVCSVTFKSEVENNVHYLKKLKIKNSKNEQVKDKGKFDRTIMRKKKG